MNALPWQDQVLIALAAFAVVGALALVIWFLIGTLEDVPRPGRVERRIPGEPWSVREPAGPGHSDVWAKPWAEPGEEDTLTWLARIHDETPGRAPDGDPGSGPARPGGDRLDRLAAAFAADTLIDARIRDWLDELIEKGLDGYRTADEWVAARTRELAAVTS